MEIDSLAITLEKTLALLRKSKSSLYSNLSVEEVILQLEEELNKRKGLRPVDMRRLKALFAPTGAIQDISIDNGWGTEFLILANVLD